MKEGEGTGAERRQEGRGGEEETESGRDGGTHSQSGDLDWHACWPSALSFFFGFSVSLKHTAGFSVAPSTPLQVPPYRAPAKHPHPSRAT